jgi:hypothetical protein
MPIPFFLETKPIKKATAAVWLEEKMGSHPLQTAESQRERVVSYDSSHMGILPTAKMGP